MATPTFDQYAARARSLYPDASDDEIGSAYRTAFDAEPVRTQGPTRDAFAARARSLYPDASDDEIDQAYQAKFGTGLLEESRRTLTRSVVAPILTGGAAITSGLGSMVADFADSASGLAERMGAPEQLGADTIRRAGLGIMDAGQQAMQYGEDVKARNAPSAAQQDEAWYSPAGLGQNVLGAAGQIGAGLATRGQSILPIALDDAGAAQQEIEAAGGQFSVPRATGYAMGSAALERAGLGRLLDRVPGRLAAAATEGGTEVAQAMLRDTTVSGDPTANLGDAITQEGLPAAIVAAALAPSKQRQTRAQPAEPAQPAAAPAAPAAGVDQRRATEMLDALAETPPEAPPAAPPAEVPRGTNAQVVPEESAVSAGITEPVPTAEPAAAPPPPPGRPPIAGVESTSPVYQAPESRRTYTPAGTPIDVVPMVVEAGSLVASDQPEFPAALQPRDRDRAQSQQQIRTIAANLQPQRLGLAPSTADGAPVVSPDGIVESGNGRVMALRQAYAAQPESAAAYRQFLADQGFDVSGFQNPVLVRVRQSELTPEQRVQFTSESNSSQGLRMTDTERALDDARKLDPGILSMLEHPDLTHQANVPFLTRFFSKLPQNEAAELVSPGVGTNDSGYRRARFALIARAYATPDNVATLQRITESSTDDNVKSVTAGMADAAKAIATLRTAIDEGLIAPEFDIGPAITRAVETVSNWREQGRSVKEMLDQTDAFGGVVTPDVETIIRSFYTHGLKRAVGREDIAGFLNAYAEAATEQRLDQSDMFGRKQTPQEILDRLLKQYRPEERAPQAQDMFGLRRAVGTPERRWDGTGPSPADLTYRWIRPIISRWKNPPHLVVVSHADELPPAVLAAIGPDIKGATDLNTGTIYLIGANLTDQWDAQRILAHEAVGHYGLMNLLGQDRWNRMVEQINALSAKDATLSRIAARVARDYGPLPPDVRAAEIVAILAETNPKHSLVERLAAMLREALRAIGFRVNMKRGDLIYLLSEAARSLNLAAPRDSLLGDSQVWTTRDGKGRLNVYAAPAYHGSPHNFEAFSLDAIGTGEGAQAYGWGLYFAESPEVANAYRRALSDVPTVTKDGVELKSAADIAQAYYKIGRKFQGYSGTDVVLDFDRQDAYRWQVKVQEVDDTGKPRYGTKPRWHMTLPHPKDLQRVLQPEGYEIRFGQLYNVDIPDDAIARMIDHEAPLGKQPPNVRRAVKTLLDNDRLSPDTVRMFKLGGDELSGSALTTLLSDDDRLGSPKAASLALAELGVPGVRYLDRGSRGQKATGTRNIVLWDQPTIDRMNASVRKIMAARPQQDQTQTPEFKRWFGDSKVVDAQGRPLVVYHGTAAPDFDRFSPGTAQGWGRGIYLTDNREQAGEDFGTGERGRVIPVYARITNPWRGGSPGSLDPNSSRAWRAVRDRWDDWLDAWNEDKGFVGDLLRERGFDGVIAEDANDIRGLEIVAFSPAQVKSAIGNAGTFDPANPSILAARPPRDDMDPGPVDADYAPRDVRAAAQSMEDNIVRDQARRYMEDNGDDVNLAIAAVTIDIGSRRDNETLKLVRDELQRRKSGRIMAARPQRNQTQTPAFKRWFGKSKVVDYDGSPLVVYHGTTADFTTFERERANIESDFGAGFYFTSERADVGNNYAGVGPDLQQKIELEAERIASETDRRYDDPDVVAEARSKWMQNDGMVVPVYLRIENPAIVGTGTLDGRPETRLDIEVKYDDDGEFVDESGTLADFIVALRNISDEYDDGSVDDAINALIEKSSGESIGMEEAISAIKDSEQFGYYTDENGRLASSEIIRRALEEIGFDGIIDRTVDKKFGSQRRVGTSMKGMRPDTVHYIAFRPEQIKSAVGNRGKFDRASPDILAARPTQQPGQQSIPGVEQPSLTTDRMQVGGGDYSLIQFGGLSTDQVAVLKDVMGELEPAVEAQRRGTRTWSMTEQAALQKIEQDTGLVLKDLVARRPGSAANAEQMESFAMLINGAVRDLTAASVRAQATGSAQDMAAVLEMREKLGLMLAPAMGFRSEAGRSLNILRKVAGELRTAQQVFDLLGEGSEKALSTFAESVTQNLQQLQPDGSLPPGTQAIPVQPLPNGGYPPGTQFIRPSQLPPPSSGATGPAPQPIPAPAGTPGVQPGQPVVPVVVINPQGAITPTVLVYKPTAWDKFYEYWINALLSGPATHQVNVLSNALFAGMESLAMAVGSATSKDLSFAEVAAHAEGVLRGIGMGVANAKAAFVQQAPQLTPQSQAQLAKTRAIAGVKGDIIRLPGRALMAEDEFFKAIGYTGKLHELAMREGIKVNPGNLPAARAYANRVIANIALRPDLIAEAKVAADRMTFQTPLGPIGQAVTIALNRSKVGRLIVPFVRTPTNILKTALEYTPAAPAREAVRVALKAGGKEAALVRGRMLVGSSMMTAAIAMAAAGALSGAGPDDEQEKQLLRQTGWEPYSVKIGDRWVRYNRFEPAGMVLGLAADAYELSRYMVGAEYEKIPALIMASLALNLGDKTFLKGLSDFSQAYSDADRYLASWATGMAATMVPSFVGQVARQMDPYQREARTLLDTIKSRIPGMRADLAKRVDLGGDPVPQEGGGVIPFQTSKVKEDALAEAMLRLGVTKGRPSRRLTFNKHSVELTAAEYEAYATYIGQVRRNIVEPIVRSPQFRQMEATQPEQAAVVLNQLLEKTTDQARLSWMMRNPTLLTRAAREKRQESIATNYLQK